MQLLSYYYVYVVLKKTCVSIQSNGVCSCSSELDGLDLDGDDEGLTPEQKAAREKERRAANNVRERYVRCCFAESLYDRNGLFFVNV